MENLPIKMVGNGSHKSAEVILREYFTDVSGLSPLSLEAKGYDLKLFLNYFERTNGHLNLATWLPLDTARFRGELIKEQYAPASINRIMATLRHFGTFGRDAGHWQINPCKGVRDLGLPELMPRAVSDVDLHRLRKASELLCMNRKRKYDQSLRNRALFETLNSSGLRISEVLGLRLEQFQQNKKFQGVLCKGSRVRNVLIAQSAADLIREYIATSRVPGSAYVFTNRYGGRISRNSIARALNRLATIASSRDHSVRVTPHMLRHAFGTRVRKIKDAPATAKMLGHKDLRYVERYATTTLAEQEEIIEAIS